MTVRISGFFRDAFPHLVRLLDDAVAAVAALDESDEDNYVAAHARADAERLAAEIGAEAAWRRATTRIFGSKPGTYGAGLLQLLDTRDWRDDDDLAAVYEAWGGYAYGRGLDGAPAQDAMRDSYARIEVAVKNVDSREHDILDSDDYYQYHGGMIATVRALTGSEPAAYLGDSSDPSRVVARTLAEETRRVFRARVANPRWIASMIRHGYKGAAELSATVDYLFGYDATAGVAEDWMYEQVAEKYLLDDDVAASWPRRTRGRRAASPSACSRRPTAACGAARPRRRWPRSASASSRSRASSRRPGVSAPAYPLTAIVGQEALVEALLVNAVAPEVGGVLVRGERGTAKSTAVRGLAPLLPPVVAAEGEPFAFAPGERAPGGEVPADAAVAERPAPLVELPLGTTLDRLVGALDLGRALAGEHAFEPGLLARAHQGILYVDEVNLLPDHLVDALLDAAASGVARVEREAVSAEHDARFILVGTMNVEEGELRPQLLDRFGLGVEVGAPTDPAVRAEIVRRRLAFERDPAAFARAGPTRSARWPAHRRRPRAAADRPAARARAAADHRRLREARRRRRARRHRQRARRPRPRRARRRRRGRRGARPPRRRARARPPPPPRPARRPPADRRGPRPRARRRARPRRAAAGLDAARRPATGSAPAPGAGMAPRRPRRTGAPADAAARGGVRAAARRRDRATTPRCPPGSTPRSSRWPGRAAARSAGARAPRPRRGVDRQPSGAGRPRTTSRSWPACARGCSATARTCASTFARAARARSSAWSSTPAARWAPSAASPASRARWPAAARRLRPPRPRRRRRLPRRRRARSWSRPARRSSAPPPRWPRCRPAAARRWPPGCVTAELLVRREALRDPTRRAIAVVLTDGRVPDPDGAIPRAAAALGRAAAAVEVVDTEEGPVRLGLASALAAAAGGRVHRLVPVTVPSRRAA